MKNNNTNGSNNFAANLTGYVEENGYIALGRQGLSYVIYSVLSGSVEVISHTQVSNPKFLRAALGTRYVTENYTQFNEAKGVREVNYDEITMDIEHNCSSMDLEFSSSIVRGLGVHRTKEGEFIINLGRRGVFNMAGQPIPRFYKGNIYVAKGVTDLDTANMADANDFAMLKEIFSSFNFQSQMHAEVLIGSLISGIVGSAMKNRPIISLEAEAGSGKTTLMRCIRTVLGQKTTKHFETMQNTAQVLACVKDGTKAMLFDEFEAKDYSKEELKSLLSLMRASFSANEDSEIVRATGSKKSSIQINCPIYLAAITPPKFEASVTSRMITLKLAKFFKKGTSLFDTDAAVNAACEQASPAIRAFVVQNLVILEKFAVTAHKALTGEGYDSRTADKWSPVIAGAMLVEYGITASEAAAAEKLVFLLPVVAASENAKRQDEVFALVSLQSALLNAEFKVGATRHRLEDLIGGVIAGDANSTMAASRLEAQGIRILDKGDSTFKLAISTAECFTAVKAVLVKAGVPAMDWKNAIRKMTGVSSDVVVKFSGKAHRAFVLSVESLLEQHVAA